MDPVALAFNDKVTAIFAKGKYRTGLVGWFVPGIAWFGAFRLARPGSLWARHRYRGRKLERAERRAQAWDARWDPIGDRLANLIGGAPSLPDPASAPAKAPDGH